MNAIQPLHMSQEQKVLDVFNRHIAAFMSGNLDEVVNDFTEQSVVITTDGVFEGLDQIRALYQGLLAEFEVIDHVEMILDSMVRGSVPIAMLKNQPGEQVWAEKRAVMPASLQENWSI